VSCNSGNKCARNFKSASRFALVHSWNFSRDYSLKCTPLGPITIAYQRLKRASIIVYRSYVGPKMSLQVSAQRISERILFSFLQKNLDASLILKVDFSCTIVTEGKIRTNDKMTKGPLWWQESKSKIHIASFICSRSLFQSFSVFFSEMPVWIKNFYLRVTA